MLNLPMKTGRVFVVKRSTLEKAAFDMESFITLLAATDMMEI
jgi:hypothetical protein